MIWQNVTLIACFMNVYCTHHVKHFEVPRCWNVRFKYTIKRFKMLFLSLSSIVILRTLTESNLKRKERKTRDWQKKLDQWFSDHININTDQSLLQLGQPSLLNWTRSGKIQVLRACAVWLKKPSALKHILYGKEKLPKRSGFDSPDISLFFISEDYFTYSPGTWRQDFQYNNKSNKWPLITENNTNEKIKPLWKDMTHDTAIIESQTQMLLLRNISNCNKYLSDTSHKEVITKIHTVTAFNHIFKYWTNRGERCWRYGEF